MIIAVDVSNIGAIFFHRTPSMEYICQHKWNTQTHHPPNTEGKKTKKKGTRVVL